MEASAPYRLRRLSFNQGVKKCFIFLIQHVIPREDLKGAIMLYQFLFYLFKKTTSAILNDSRRMYHKRNYPIDLQSKSVDLFLEDNKIKINRGFHSSFDQF